MKRWQDPKIEIRKDVPRPYFYIRPYVPVAGSAGLQRVQRRIPLGFVGETTMRAARSRKEEIMEPINQGKFILQAQIRFSALVEKYREARLPILGAATRKKYETHIDNHILPVFGKAELADIDRQSIEAWLTREAEGHTHQVGSMGKSEVRQVAESAAGQVSHPGKTSLASRSEILVRNRPDTSGSTPELSTKKYAGLGSWALLDLRNIMSAIFTAAIDWGLWPNANPCKRVKIGAKIEKREKRIPSATDLQSFLGAIDDTAIINADAARLMVLVAVVAGLRVSEVLGLQAGDIDVKAGTLRVVRRWHRGEVGPTKSAASRRVRQIGPLADQLAALGRGRTYLFERSNGKLPDDRDLQQHVFRPAAEAVGIYQSGFGMHTFRRLNITWRQEAGATPFEAMKAAGHSKPETTWLYTITDAGRERDHVEAILKRAMPENMGGIC